MMKMIMIWPDGCGVTVDSLYGDTICMDNIVKNPVQEVLIYLYVGCQMAWMVTDTTRLRLRLIDRDSLLPSNLRHHRNWRHY